MKVDPVVTMYRAGSVAFRTLPLPAADLLARTIYRIAAGASAQRRLIVERNVVRVLGPGLDRAELDRLVRLTFESYGRYWVDSFRLPDMSVEAIDAGMDYSGYESIERAVASGTGPIVVLPHLGSWEWAGVWLTLVPKHKVTVVVEPVEPPELFDFFVRFRERLGMNIVPLGPGAASEVLRAIKAGHVLCLLADRDIDGTGLEVEFFGETTRLPAGPAALALRTGAPLLPAACYFKRRGVSCVVGPPMKVERRSHRFREDVARLTQDIASELEELIRRAPEQWHLQQPNWPSDHAALDALVAAKGRSGVRRLGKPTRSLQPCE